VTEKEGKCSNVGVLASAEVSAIEDIVGRVTANERYFYGTFET
jgi:hypothetical protein